MAKGKNPNQVYVGQQQVTCPFCRHDRFFQRDIKLNTTGMSFLGFDWLNQDANGLICAQCGHIEMFLNPDIRFVE